MHKPKSAIPTHFERILLLIVQILNYTMVGVALLIGIVYLLVPLGDPVVTLRWPELPWKLGLALGWFGLAAAAYWLAWLIQNRKRSAPLIYCVVSVVMLFVQEGLFALMATPITWPERIASLVVVTAICAYVYHNRHLRSLFFR